MNCFWDIIRLHSYCVGRVEHALHVQHGAFPDNSARQLLLDTQLSRRSSPEKMWRQKFTVCEGESQLRMNCANAWSIWGVRRSFVIQPATPRIPLTKITRPRERREQVAGASFHDLGSIWQLVSCNGSHSFASGCKVNPSGRSVKSVLTNLHRFRISRNEFFPLPINIPERAKIHMYEARLGHRKRICGWAQRSSGSWMSVWRPSSTSSPHIAA